MTRLPAVFAALCPLMATPSAYACAAPRPFFGGLYGADAIILGTVTTFEPLDERMARVTFDLREVLKGAVKPGPLAVLLDRRSPPDDRWRHPVDAIVSLKRVSPAAGADYQIMQPGCGPIEIYSAADRDSIMTTLIRYRQMERDRRR